MTHQVEIEIATPVRPQGVVDVMSQLPDMPAILGATCKPGAVVVEYEDELSATQKSTIEAYGPTLPFACRQMQYIKAASEEIEEAITSGVTSDVTGTVYTYDSDRDSQLNLIGAIVGQADMYWHAKLPGTKMKIPVLHTHAQIVGLGNAVKAWKETRIFLYQTFVGQVMAASNMAEIDALHASFDPYAEVTG